MAYTLNLWHLGRTTSNVRVLLIASPSQRNRCKKHRATSNPRSVQVALLASNISRRHCLALWLIVPSLQANAKCHSPMHNEKQIKLHFSEEKCDSNSRCLTFLAFCVGRRSQIMSSKMPWLNMCNMYLNCSASNGLPVLLLKGPVILHLPFSNLRTYPGVPESSTKGTNGSNGYPWMKVMKGHF